MPSPERRDLSAVRMRPLDGIKKLAGRDRYINILRMIMNAVEKGEGRCVLIEGEIGVGKTTLVNKFAEEVDAKFIRVQGLTYRSFEPYLPFLEVLGGEEVEESLPSLLIPNSGHHDDLIKIRREALPEKIRQKIIALSEERPLILFLDDMQWMDEGSLTVFLYILRSLKGRKILLIGAYRPEDLITEGGKHPLRSILDRIEGGGDITKISLPNLSFGDFRYLMEEILGYRISQDILKLMYERTSGNPYLINEYLGELIARGILDPDKGIIKSGVKIEEISIPQNVKGILLRKMSMVSEEAKKILRISSVIGNAFSFEELVEISGMDEEKIADILEELINLDFIEEAGDRYRFKYYQLGRAIYENISKIHRKILHRKVAEYFEKVSEDPFILGKHYYLAGNKEKAFKYLIEAARKSQQRGAYRTSLWYLEKLLTIGAENSEIYYMMLNAEIVVGEGSRAKEYFEKIDEESEYYAPAVLLLSIYLEESGKFNEAQELIQKAIDRVSGDAKALLLSKMAFLAAKYESPEKALSIVEEAMKYAENDFTKGVLWKTRGIAYYYKSDVENALKSFHEAEKIIAEWNKIHPEMVRILNDLGLTYLALNDLHEANRYFWECRKIAEKLGFIRMIPTVLNNSSWIYLSLGSVYESEKLFREAMERASVIDDVELVARTHVNLAYVYLLMGEYEKTVEYASKVFELVPGHSELERRARYRTALARIFMGYVEEGEKVVKNLAETESNKVWKYTYLTDLLYYLGKYDELVDYVHSILPEMANFKEDFIISLLPAYLYLGMEERYNEALNDLKGRYMENTVEAREIALVESVRTGNIENALKILNEFWNSGLKNPSIYISLPLVGYLYKKGCGETFDKRIEEMAKEINDKNALRILRNIRNL